MNNKNLRDPYVFNFNYKFHEKHEFIHTISVIRSLKQ